MLIKIYTLTDPRTNQVRYVGKTKQLLKFRFNNHYTLYNHKYYKACWIKSLRSLNLKPIIEIIDEVEENNWKFWEQYWISQFKTWGFKLTNMTNGGDGMLGYKNKNKYKHTQKTKDIISRKNKAIIKSEEWKRKAAEGKKKPIIGISIIDKSEIEFKSTTDASLFLGNLDYKKNIVAVLKGRRNIAYGYNWVYKNIEL
jgi:hypothetical protein